MVVQHPRARAIAVPEIRTTSLIQLTIIAVDARRRAAVGDADQTAVRLVESINDPVGNVEIQDALDAVALKIDRKRIRRHTDQNRSGMNLNG
jgi:hypothetical protein